MGVALTRVAGDFRSVVFLSDGPLEHKPDRQFLAGS